MDFIDNYNPSVKMASNKKFNETNALKRVQEYIDSTYDKHYAQGSIQSTEFINSIGHGEGFCLGNYKVCATIWKERKLNTRKRTRTI